MSSNLTNGLDAIFNNVESPQIQVQATVAGATAPLAQTARQVSDSMSEAMGASVSVADGSFTNSVTKTGSADYANSAGQFSTDMITFNRSECTSIYHSSWVFRRLVDKVAQDMWSAGININTDNTPEEIARVYKRFNRLKSELIYATQQARIYGGAAALLMVDDGSNDLSQPLNLKGIRRGARLRLFITDRWYGLSTGSEMVTNYKNIDFNTPKYYTFTLEGLADTARVHHSRILRFVNRRSPRLIQQMLQGWGVSELEHVYQDLMNYENTKNSVASLVNKALLEIVKVAGMRGMISGLTRGNTGSQAQLAGQLTALNQFRTSNNLVLLDKEDEYSQEAYSLSGLDTILAEQKVIIAGAAEMPQVLLYGDTKGGMTSDSPAEMEFYSQTIQGKQEQDCRPVLDKLLPVLFRIEGLEVPADLDYEFESVVGLSLDKKNTILSSTKETAISLLEAGLITHETALKEIQEVSKATGFGSNISNVDEALAKKSDSEDAEAPPEDETTAQDDEQYLKDKVGETDYTEAKQKALRRSVKIFDKIKRLWK